MDTQTLIAALDQLTPDEIRERLADIAAEEKALRTILRAALARQRAKAKKPSTEAAPCE